MYIPRNFTPEEFVPRKVYMDRREKSLQLIDPNLLHLADILRDEFGRATINDWKWGGGSQWRGLRTVNSPYYSPYSQHTFGRAIDIVFSEVTAQQARDWLKEHTNKLLMKLSVESITVEEQVSWLHVDLRNNYKGYNSFWP